MNFRKEIIPALKPYFEKDEKLFLLYGDMGFGGIEDLQEAFPNRVLNFGIAEQAMVGVAAGMAMSGWKPIVYTMCNFLCYRALEQIRNDVVLQNLNVKFIGTGANNYFSFLGKSHTCNTDDIKILEIIGLTTFDPNESCILDKHYSLEEDVKMWLNWYKASYIRV